MKPKKPLPPYAILIITVIVTVAAYFGIKAILTPKDEMPDPTETTETKGGSSGGSKDPPKPKVFPEGTVLYVKDHPDVRANGGRAKLRDDFDNPNDFEWKNIGEELGKSNGDLRLSNGIWFQGVDYWSWGVPYTDWIAHQYVTATK